MGWAIVSNQTRNALIIFVRYPEKGKVKTRLAKSLGDEFALSFYKTITENFISEIRDKTDFKVYIFYAGTLKRFKILEWLGEEFDYQEQSGLNLGERMADAFRKAFWDEFEKAVIIGTDIPDINIDSVRNSFKDLEDNDIVITPSHDGGYCLLGMKSFHPELFENIEWSSSLVFGSTLKKCSDKGLKVHVYAKLFDIDTEDDLIDWLSGEGDSEIKTKIRNLYEQTKNKH